MATTDADDAQDEAEVRATGNLVADISEQTEFPEALIAKLLEMWRTRSPPHFLHVQGDVLPLGGLRAIVKDLGVTHALLLESVVRVMTEGAPADRSLDFARFMRGYGWLQSRTLARALPFVFRVFDLDGDGKLARSEFEQVLSAVISLGGANPEPVRRMVEAQFAEHETTDLSYEQFRYFVSLNTQSVFAACAFMPHVQHFSASALVIPAGGGRAGADARASGAPGAEDGLADVSDVPFFDESFMSALESLKSTAVERAGFAKDKGNAAFKKGRAWWPQALELYSKGLRERGDDDATNAALLANRAAIHLSFKNHRHALNDSLASLRLAPANAKAARRAALSAHALGELDEATRACALALELLEPAAGEPPHADVAELRALSAQIDAARRARAEVQQLELAKQLVEAELQRAIAARGITLAPFRDEATRAQLVGEHSGARVWWDADEDELHWPVLLLYPHYQQTDFLQDVCETTRVLDILAQVLPADGPRAPWDARGEYAEESVNVYLAPGNADQKPRQVRLDVSIAELTREEETVVPGVPMLLVLARGSAYEREWRRQEELDE